MFLPLLALLALAAGAIGAEGYSAWLKASCAPR
jgi:hypothetical protein